MNQLAHIINPFKVKQSSGITDLMSMTFESMRIAKRIADDQIQIRQYAICYEEDAEIIPAEFVSLPCLNRSVQDLGSFNDKRKLPLLCDILSALQANSDADFFIYTNADIILQPHFYAAVKRLLEEGHDALIINRRRVSSKYTKVEDLPLLLSDSGRSHPGFDCFVFHRSLLEKFSLGRVCIGIPFMEITLAHNVFAYAKNFLYVDELHLTSHIGLRVMSDFDQDLYDFNRNEYEKIFPTLRPLLSLKKMPYASLPAWKRMIKWGLNPSLSIALWGELQFEETGNPIRYIWNEIRFRILQK